MWVPAVHHCIFQERAWLHRDASAPPYRCGLRPRGPPPDTGARIHGVSLSLGRKAASKRRYVHCDSKRETKLLWPETSCPSESPMSSPHCGGTSESLLGHEDGALGTGRGAGHRRSERWSLSPAGGDVKEAAVCKAGGGPSPDTTSTSPLSLGLLVPRAVRSGCREVPGLWSLPWCLSCRGQVPSRHSLLVSAWSGKVFSRFTQHLLTTRHIRLF